LTNPLVTLALEKRYEAITVQDLLDHADMGRSTFYAHYRGKDDLLLRELFCHLGRSRTFYQALSRARVLDRMYPALGRRPKATGTADPTPA